ncbi:unnamed protein product [Porites lobata]|uniref:Uncharacterized protein n=1 Tax=Porites lobata TaxID=104759 RepID=A0ABN8QEZ1_9CNID|nr:unnamed protein product [Porites lobata]
MKYIVAHLKQVLRSEELSPKPGKSTSEGIKCTQRKEKLQAGGGKALNLHRFDTTGKTGNRWSPATIRVALAICSRSPAAFRAVRSLGILQLPCSKEIRRIIGK